MMKKAGKMDYVVGCPTSEGDDTTNQDLSYRGLEETTSH
jgi:hypothetical protein